MSKYLSTIQKRHTPYLYRYFKLEGKKALIAAFTMKMSISRRMYALKWGILQTLWAQHIKYFPDSCYVLCYQQWCVHINDKPKDMSCKIFGKSNEYKKYLKNKGEDNE